MRRIDYMARFLFAAALVHLLAGCSVTIEMTSHQPAHPMHEDVTLSATATGEVARLELWLTEYEIKTDGSLNATAPASLVKLCDPAFWKSTLNCSVTLPLDSDHTLMVYEARAFAFLGGQKSESYAFASGQYSRDDPELPGDREPIPIRVNSFDTKGFLDIVMIPDKDLLQIGAADPAAGFRAQLHEVIAMYFDYEAIRKARGLFNFYYSPEDGEYSVDAGNCVWTGPVNLGDLEDIADVILYLHQEKRLDCTQGSKISSEIWYDKTLVHESGHGLFGLRDEYRICDGSYYPDQPNQVCMRNIWRNKDYTNNSGKLACKDDVPPGLQPSDCTYIIPPGQVYRIDPADIAGLPWSDDKCSFDETFPGYEDRAGCIMGDLQHNDPSDFGPACLRRIDFRYGCCLFGECLPDDECTVCPQN